MSKRNAIPNDGTVKKRQYEINEETNHALRNTVICDLPDVVLEKIISRDNLWQQNVIRLSSKRLCDVSDAYIMHRYKAALHRYSFSFPNSEGCAALRVIKEATEMFVKSGYHSTFCGSFLPMLRDFCPDIRQSIKFLLHFYNMVDKVTGNLNSQQSLLLYHITLLRFLKRFSNAKIISSTSTSLHWHVVIELKGPWMQLLSSSNNLRSDDPKKLTNLVLILSEMLMSSIAGRTFRRIWDCRDHLYLFGYNSNDNEHPPTTVFEFDVRGSHNVCSILQLCIEEMSCDPLQLPNDHFKAYWIIRSEQEHVIYGQLDEESSIN